MNSESPWRLTGATGAGCVTSSGQALASLRSACGRLWAFLTCSRARQVAP